MVTEMLREPHYVVGDWQADAFRTDPADRARAEAGVAAAYAAAGLAAPGRFVWVPSPARGAVAAAVLGGHEAALRKAGLDDLLDRARADLGEGAAGASVLAGVRTRPWEAERTAACSEQGPEQWPRTWA